MTLKERARETLADYGSWEGVVENLIIHAMLAFAAEEREACARVAEASADMHWPPPVDVGAMIATAIRNRKDDA